MSLKRTIGAALNPDNYVNYTASDGHVGVLIHPGLPYDFLEVNREWVEKLRDYMVKKAALVDIDIETWTPSDELVALFFENAF